MGRVSDAKERLMDAVLELIWSGSYGSTTIDHICDKAGVKSLLEAERQESRAGRVSYLIEFEALQKFCKEHRSLLITRRVSPYKILFLEEYVVAPKHAELLRTRESKREVEACRTKARISLISQVCDLL